MFNMGQHSTNDKLNQGALREKAEYLRISPKEQALTAGSTRIVFSKENVSSDVDTRLVTLKTDANLPKTSNRIELRFLQENAPLNVRVAPEQDGYLLWVPLRRCEAVLESDGRVLFDGTVCPGMLTMTCPHEQTNKRFRTPMHAALISYPGQLVRSTLLTQPPETTQSSFSPLLRPDYQVQRIAAALLSAVEFDPTQRQLFIDGLAYALLACLNRNRRTAPKRNKMHASDGLTDDDLGRCIRFADAKISERFELQEWAAVLGMGVPEFARLFQARTRQSPYAWLMNSRIDRSKEMLQSRESSLADVALCVGFCSQSHFTEAFRRRVGISPGRWRSKILSS